MGDQSLGRRPDSELAEAVALVEHTFVGSRIVEARRKEPQ
jgi:hypothetical protein